MALFSRNASLDKSDAFRHSYWSVLIAKYYGTKKDDIEKGFQLSEKWPFRKTALYAKSDEEYKAYMKTAADNAKKAAKSVAGVDAVRGNNLIYFDDL